MTFALFGQISMLGEVMAGRPPGAEQPFIDPTGRLLPRPDDGTQPDPTGLVSVAAGELGHPDDPGRVVFSSVGLQAVVTRTSARLGLLAQSQAAGQWAGEVHFAWITDLVVRPRAGRRDPGGIRILFLDPSTVPPQPGRQFVDLVTPRQLPAGHLAWELVQRIVTHRHGLLPPAAVEEHRQVSSVLVAGQRPLSEPAWYVIPHARVDAPPAAGRLGDPGSSAPYAATPALDSPGPFSVERTMRVVAPTGVPPTVLGLSPWSPTPVDPAIGVAPLPVAGPGQMISAVPGAGRPPGRVVDPVGDRTAGRADPTGSFRVELDSGEVLVVDAPTLFGRDPTVVAGERAVLQSLSDDTLSFSKTHLLLAPSPGGISVTDRHSTNGVLVEHGGRLSACGPGVPTPLTLPATLRMGSRRMVVTKA